MQTTETFINAPVHINPNDVYIDPASDEYEPEEGEVREETYFKRMFRNRDGIEFPMYVKLLVVKYDSGVDVYVYRYYKREWWPYEHGGTLIVNTENGWTIDFDKCNTPFKYMFNEYNPRLSILFDKLGYVDEEVPPTENKLTITESEVDNIIKTVLNEYLDKNLMNPLYKYLKRYRLTESVNENYLYHLGKDIHEPYHCGNRFQKWGGDYRRDVLTERISSIVYHFCGYSSCLGICERNEFVLSHITRGTADGKINKDYHYLSLTRQKSNKVGFSQSRPVRITINGDKLNQRYKGGPVDYWGASMGKQQYMKDGSERGHYDMHQSRTENEDRVFSSDPVIPNASEYIMRIDILITTDRDGKYNKWHLQWIQDILKTGFEKLVFVYGDENSFNAQNNNTINEQIRQIDNGEHLDDRTYVGSICSALLDLLNVIFSYEYDRDNIWSACYQKLKEYGMNRYILQKYGLDFVKRVEEELPRKSWNVDSIFANTQNMIDTLRDNDKTLYVRGVRMLNDYLREHNLHNLYDVIHYKQKIVEKINSRYYGPRLDWNKTYKCLALADLNYEEGSDYIGGIIAIPSPDTTSIWKIIPQERGYFVDDVMRQNPQHTSRNDDYFRRYLQHIVRNETSVTAFVDFMNKLHVSDESKEEILGYKKFVTATLKASNFDHARYVTQADKDMVEKALEFDI